ncbi:hypothetical protein ACFX11_014871 [Malus domestica]
MAQGSYTDVVTMVVAKKKLALSLKKTTTVLPTLSGKRSFLEAEAAGDTPRSKKCIKKLAKKKKRKIHVIFNQTA